MAGVRSFVIISSKTAAIAFASPSKSPEKLIVPSFCPEMYVLARLPKEEFYAVSSDIDCDASVIKAEMSYLPTKALESLPCLKGIVFSYFIVIQDNLFKFFYYGNFSL